MIALLLGLAHATPLADTFSWRVTASCPAEGLCRVEVPPPFVAANPRSWLLVNQSGALEPFAVLEEEDADPDIERASMRATEDPAAMAISPREGQAIAEIRLRFPRGNFQAEAWVETRSRPGQPWRAGPKEIIAAGLVDRALTRLHVPDPDAAELRLVFDRPWTALPTSAEVELALIDRALLLPARVTLPTEASGPAEDGMTRYQFNLPGAALIRAIEVDPVETTYEREVSLGAWEADGVGLAHVERERGLLRRVSPASEPDQPFGRVDLATDRFTISVDDDWDQPLQIPNVDVLLARRVLLVRDAGDLVLFGGDPDYAASFDLQLERGALARERAVEAKLGPVEPNPEHRDPLDLAALSPGSVVDPARFRFSRHVSGGGLARVDLPPDVQMNTRADLSDLRLVDGANQQIPYVVDRGALQREIEGTSFDAEQAGELTRIRVRLPSARTPLSSLILESPDTAFSREIRVSAGEGSRRRLLAASSWEGATSGRSRRALALSTVVEGGLLVEIEHGDNRAIAVDRVRLYGPTVAVLARLPAEGATLLYGDVADVQGRVRGPLREVRENGWEEPLDAPRYDAARLASALTRAPAITALLGPAVERAPAVAAGDRGVVTAGIGALVLGLLGLVGWLLKDLRREGGSPLA